jgi:hypothetical protein
MCLASLGLLVSAPAQAAWSWQVDPSCSNQLQCDLNGSGGAPAGTVQGWSFTGGTNNTQLRTAYLSAYGGDGVGVTNRDASGTADTSEGSSPEHAVDNNQRYDVVLLSFAQPVSLNQVTIGWRAYDSDISVLALANGTPNLSGQTVLGLAGQGWKLVGQYDGPTGPAGGTSSDANIPVNTQNNFSSQYWLVGAYNPNFVNNATGATYAAGLTSSTEPATQVLGNPSYLATSNPDNRDYVKLFKFAATSVPEPNSALLLGIATLGLAGFRRLKRQ